MSAKVADAIRNIRYLGFPPVIQVEQNRHTSCSLGFVGNEFTQTDQGRFVMAETAMQQNPATIRPCTAQGLIYRAYKRPYDGGPSNVLTLYASGYYGDAPWEIFFVGVE